MTLGIVLGLLVAVAASAASSVTIGSVTIALVSSRYYARGEYTRFAYEVKGASTPSCAYWILGSCDEFRDALWWMSDAFEWVTTPLYGLKVTPNKKKQTFNIDAAGQWSVSTASVGVYVAGQFLQGWVDGPACSGSSLSVQVAAGVDVVFPQVTGAIAGARRLDGSTTQAGAAGATVIVTHSVEGRVVTLRVETHVDVQGLILVETYSGPVELSSLDAAGGRFDTVERLCTSWIGVSESVVQLAMGEWRDVALTITTPDAMDGAYWSSLFVEAQPEIIEQGGTRILRIPRTAIKIFVTAPGTEVLAGSVSSVSVLGTAPLAVTPTFENEGNVELVVSGQLEIVDRTGTVVGQTAIAEFKVLPGSARVVSVSESVEVAGLPTGIYQAVVRLEYGGYGPVVGVRGFRVP